MQKTIMLFAGILAAAGGAEARSAQFTVVSVYEGMSDYAEAAAANPAANRQALWQEMVIEPYWETCAEGGKYLDYGPPLASAMADIEALRASTAALQASSVEVTVRAALEQAAQILPGPDTTVCILAADSSWAYLRDMHGVGGSTVDAGKVWLTVLPEGDWEDWITYAVAHEYHHSVWMAGPREIADMADYLVFEGRADTFARLVAPRGRVPWTSALTADQERAAWRIIEPHLGSTDARLMQGFMFGGVEGVPRWAGYTIGFRVVQTYLEAHPELTIDQWTAIPAGEFVRQATAAPALFGP